MDTEVQTDASRDMSRRDAIKRTAIMLGLTLSGPALRGAAAAQAAREESKARGATYFDSERFATVAAIVERILPRTDTPGAADVGVPEFVDLMYGKYQSKQDVSLIDKGLALLDDASRKAEGRRFADLPVAGQLERLRLLAVSKDDSEKAFLRKMRELALLGYFTSEEIGKGVLKFDPIPGSYQGCSQLSDTNGVAWTI